MNKLKDCVVYENNLAKVIINGKKLHQRNLKQESEPEIENLN